MSQFNIYARKLDEAFKEARSEYNTAFRALQEAQQASRDANAWKPGDSAEEKQVRTTRAALKLHDAEATFNEVSARVWDNFKATRRTIRAELEQAVRAANIANPVQRIDRGRGQQPPPFFLSLGFIRGFFSRLHRLYDLIALRLCLNRSTNKRRNGFPRPLCGLLRRFKCGRGKDSPLALRRSCGLLRAISHSFTNGTVNKSIHAFAGLCCKSLYFFFPTFWNC